MKKLIPLSALMLGLTACGGGGGSNNSGTATGLEMPTAMSVVSAQNETVPTGITGLNINMQAIPLSAILTDPTTDYTTDPTQTYVWDESMESLQTVNMILCLMNQTRASQMVNQGAYTALINEDKCEQGNNQSDATGGGGSSSQVTQFNKWTIESTRADNSSPQIVKLWVPGDNDPNEDPMDNEDILVEVTTTEGVSNSKPFGDFVLNFKGVIDQGIMMGGSANGTMMTTMAGTLQTVANADGKPQFQFINLAGDALTGAGTIGGSRTEKSNVILDDASGTSGIAKTFFSETYDPDGSGGQASVTNTNSFDLAFNAANFLNQKNDGTSTSQVCSSRTTFNTQVWRYNLYHQTDGSFNGQAITGGQRVELNSGFPFVFNGTYGHMSYWGLWLEDESVTLSDADVINQFDYNSDTTVPHTVNLSDGKLHRRTANTETLTNLQGKDFFGWANHSVLGSPSGPDGNGYDSWVIRVTGDNEFELYAGVTWGENGPQIDDNGVTDEVITPTNNGEQLWLWSDALGGNIIFTKDTATPANRTVTFYAQDEVSPGDTTIASGVTLYCYDRCPMGGLSAPENDAVYYYPSYETLLNAGAAINNADVTAGGLRTYSLSAANGKITLTDDTNTLPVVVNTLPATNQWGMDSGEMLLTDLADVFHPEANSGGTVFTWSVYDLAAGGQSYRWETGSNNWNRLMTVTRNSDSQLVSFDKPLRFTYTHSTANDTNSNTSNDGGTLLLEYGGPGQLWGFPWEVEAGCDPATDNCRWRATVTLKDGTTLTDGTNNFAVKAMEKEQSMVVLGSLANCASLDVTTASDLPLLTTVNADAVSFTQASKPNITAAPAVIEGEIQ